MDYSTRSHERYLKRKKQVRMQRITLAAVIVIAVVILSIIFGTRFAYADSSEPDMVSQKYFKSIVIQPGDTLTSIAEEHISSDYKDIKQYINEVKRTNYMLDDDLHAGDSLIVPYYQYTIEIAMN